ncbi:MAG: DUF4230 domain-containing protein [Anaerolineales bacterium]
MRRNWLIAFFVILLIIFAAAAFAVVSTVQRTTRPVTDLSQSVGTQVSQLLNPTPTIRPDPVTIVREVRSLARLETIQYSLEKVITAESGQGPFGFLFGDRLLLVAHGTVIAGVDLGQLGPLDVWLDDGGRVYLRLPEPDIFVATLDNETTYVYDRETGLLTQGSVDLEAEARRAAEDAIREAALEDEILKQARVNAEAFLFRFLRSLEYEDVIFVGPEESPPPTSTPSPAPLATNTPSS